LESGRSAGFYSFGRVSAILGMNVADYYPRGKRFFVGLSEKGDKYHEVPVHHKAEENLAANIQAAGLSEKKDAPLFRSSNGKGKGLGENRISRIDTWKMIKRRSLLGEIREEISPHSFRATGITLYLESGGSSKTPRPLPITNQSGPPSSMTGPVIRSVWTRLSAFQLCDLS
jgi:integrase/recombinase XerD